MRIPLKKIARVIAWGFGILLGTVLLALAGAVLWLRTDTGERTIAGLAKEALAAQGLFLETEIFAGPLPSRLRLAGVRLADENGEWFTAREVEVRLALADILRRTVTVSLVRVDTPEIFRLPVLPPQEPSEDPAPPQPAEPGYFSLPVGVRLDELVIENAGVHAPLLFPELPESPKSSESPDRGPVVRVSVRGDARAGAREALTAKLGMEAAVADMAQLASLLQAGQIPANSLRITTDATATIGEAITAAALGTLAATLPDGNDAALKYSLEAALDENALKLSRALVEGLGIRLEASGGYTPRDGSAKGEAHLQTAENGMWQDILADVAGLRLGGAITADIDASLSGAGAAAATATLAGTGMHWGVEQAQALLGPAFSLEANAGGGGGAPYTVRLASLKAGGLNASGDAVFSPESGTLEASLEAGLEDVAPLVPGTSGAVRAKASATGPLTAPAFSLEASAKSIRNQAGTFGGLQAAITGTAHVPPSGARSVRGTARISLDASPAGPVSCQGGFTAAQGAGGSLDAGIHDLALSLAGTALTADITVTVPEGAGALPSAKGAIAASVTDWKPLAAFSGVPISGGAAGFTARFTHDAKGQEVTASWNAQRLVLPDTFILNDISGTLEATDLLTTPDMALRIALGPGEAGPLDWRTGALAVTAKRGAGDFAVALRMDQTARTALAGLASSGTARPARGERLSAAGAFSLDPMQVTLNRLAARVPDSPMGVYLTAPTTISLGDTVRVREMRLGVVPGNGAVACDASLGAAEAEVTASITDFPFRLARELTGAPLPDGAIDLTAELRKKGAAVTGTLNAKAAVRQGELPPAVLTLASALDKKPDPHFPDLRSPGGVVRLKGSIGLGVGTEPAPQAEPFAVFNIPLRFSPEGVPGPDMNAPLAARAAWQGDVAPLWAFAPMPDRTLTGIARINASLTGNLAKPAYTADAYLAGGRFTDAILGIALTDIALQAQSDSEGKNVLRLRAEDGRGGYVALEGSLLPPEEAPGKDTPPGMPRIAARGHINHLEPLHRDDLFLRLSGRVAVDGPVNAMRLAAAMEVERGELSLLTSLGGGVRTLEITDPNAEPPPRESGSTCDITVSIPNRFFIRGRGLDSEWEGDLAVRGPLSGPSLTGSLRPLRGSFDLLSRAFAFDKGDISFFGGDRIDPALNLSLTYTGPNITAIVRALGSASKPELKMESRPPLPQDQIMAEVLFGKDFSQLSRFEALQVANSVRQLANIGDAGLDPLASMRTNLGLDMLRVGSSGSGAAESRSISGAPGAENLGGGGAAAHEEGTATPTVEAGKYINDSIYVGVEQGATADSTGVRVEVELLPNLTLQGKSSARSSEVGIGWKKDY